MTEKKTGNKFNIMKIYTEMKKEKKKKKKKRSSDDDSIYWIISQC